MQEQNVARLKTSQVAQIPLVRSTHGVTVTNGMPRQSSIFVQQP